MKRVNFLCLAILGLLLGACHSNDDTDGDWSRSYSFAGLNRTGAVSFTMQYGGKECAFIGLGTNEDKVNDKDKTLRDFWMFDGRTWTQVDSFPLAAQGRYGAVAFVINGKAYVGTGFRPSTGTTDLDIYFKDFWEFDPTRPAGSQWSASAVTELPSVGRREAVAFSLNGKGYVGTGLADGSQALKDFWCYDPGSNTWTVSNFNGEIRLGAVAFVLGDKAVVCLGTGSANGTSYRMDVNIFNGSTNEWSVSPYPLRDISGRGWDNDYGRIPRAYAVAFTSSRTSGVPRGYIATGQGNYRNTCWEYDIERDRWYEVTELPSAMTNRAFAVGFTLNDYGYVTTGGTSTGITVDADTWKFTPGIEEDDDNDYTPQD